MPPRTTRQPAHALPNVPSGPVLEDVTPPYFHQPSSRFPLVLARACSCLTGYAAPQLHTHVVFFNMTQSEDGKVRSVDPDQLYKSQKFGTAVYRAHFAEKLQALGYEIRVDPRTGAPEIKGFTEEYLQDSSPRRKEVLKEKGKMKERLEREGKTVSDNARLQQAAARINRRSKNFDHGEMQERALEMDAKHDNQARRIAAQARARLPLRLPQNEIEIRAQEAVTFA